MIFFQRKPTVSARVARDVSAFEKLGQNRDRSTHRLIGLGGNRTVVKSRALTYCTSMDVTRTSLLAGIGVATFVAIGPLAANAAAKADGAKVVVFYKTPKDQAAFDAYYFGTHVGKASKLPGLRSYIVNRSPIVTPDGKPSGTYSFFAELGFDSLDAIQAALGSPQGATVVADLANFAQAGVDITMFEVKPVA
jgi:uncharacterized protein (TIGR02118 family)